MGQETVVVAEVWSGGALEERVSDGKLEGDVMVAVESCNELVLGEEANCKYKGEGEMVMVASGHKGEVGIETVMVEVAVEVLHKKGEGEEALETEVAVKEVEEVMSRHIPVVEVENAEGEGVSEVEEVAVNYSKVKLVEVSK